MSRPLSRRQFHRGFLATGAAALLASASACSTSKPATDDSPTSGRINVMYYPGLFDDLYTEAVIEPFRKAFPGIEVTTTAQGTATDILAALRTQKRSPTADVVIMDLSVAETAISEGLFAPMTPAEVPNLENVLKVGRHSRGYGPALTFDSLSLMHNPKVTPGVQGWESLWTRNRASIALTKPPIITAYIWTAVIAYRMGIDYRADIRPAIQHIAELSPRVQTFDPQPEQYSIVQSGTVDLSVGYNARGQAYAKASGGSLAVAPTKGNIHQINTINATAGTENPRAARTFINYALSVEAQTALAEAMYYAPSVRDVKLSDHAESRLLRADARDVLAFEWSWFTAKPRTTWSQLWRDEIVGA